MQHEPGSVGRWLQYARGDMAMAEQPMSADVPYLLRCFHAQQAAEKSVKAVLLRFGVAFPSTHNLSVPFALVPQDVPRPPDLAGTVGLTVYAVSARYPDEIDEATETEHRKAVALARAAVRWAESTIAAG
jgi:HEPN domain-containing protein